MPGDKDELPAELVNPEPEDEEEPIAIELPHEEGDENANTV